MDTDSNEQFFTKTQELLWSRPERKSQKAKVAIIGGHSGGFQSTQAAYTAMLAEGAGETRVLLPDSLRTKLPPHPDISFAQSTKLGSFSQDALSPMQELATWADIIYLSGELSSNNETVLTLERFTQTTATPMVATADAAIVASRHNLLAPLTLVIDLLSLQDITKQRHLTQTVTSSATVEQTKEAMHVIASQLSAMVVLVSDRTAFLSDPDNACISLPANKGVEARLAVMQGEFPTRRYEAALASLLGSK